MIGLRGLPSKDGGVEVAVSELAPRLVSLKIDCTVYSRSNYVNISIKKYKGVNIIVLPTINTKHLEAFIFREDVTLKPPDGIDSLIAVQGPKSFLVLGNLIDSLKLPNKPVRRKLCRER